MPDNNDSLLGFVRNPNPNILTEEERGFGMTQGMKNMMGGAFKGVLPPIKSDAHYAYTWTTDTGDKIPFFKVVKEGHPLAGSDVSAQTLVDNGLSAHVPDITDKIKSLQAAGAPMEDMENAVQEIQNVHNELGQASRMAWGQALKGGFQRLMNGGISGAVLPPFLEDILQAGQNQRRQFMGGA